jgi:hypothetical protein
MAVFKLSTKKKKNCEKWRFTILELSHEFHTLYPLILSQVLRKKGSENANAWPHKEDNSNGCLYLERYHKEGDEFLNNTE